jgi:hypothetical protein
MAESIAVLGNRTFNKIAKTLIVWPMRSLIPLAFA